MKRTTILGIALFFCTVALADYCPTCRATVMQEDAFCAGCGYNLSAWRQRQASQRKNLLIPKSDIYKKTAYGNPKSRVVTPFKLTIIEGLAVPWTRDCDIYGLHLAVIGGESHAVYGLSVNGLGSSSEKLGGLGCGMFNISQEVCGFQVGFYNSAKDLHGLQIGAINYAESDNSSGIQIGAFNTFGSKKGRGWFFPVINMCF